jgi:retron-type reverse transcriptase
MPQRVSGLWPRLTTFENLWLAYRKARRGKRHGAEVAAFEYDLEGQVLVLQRELAERNYRPGPYVTFTIHEPKPRFISVAPFRDRVVHHALMNVLEPVFDARMCPDSYACRKGKGTHAALDRYTHFARRFGYVWHGDIRKFFPTIDHEILRGMLRRIVKDAGVLWLAETIMDASNPQQEVQAWFPGDDLFSPLERRKGLPLGNMTSQWFANLYLDPFDHFVKQTLRAAGYVRYCDDFCAFASDPAVLRGWMRRCREFLEGNLRLQLNPKSRQVTAVRRGLSFLGFRVFPNRRRVAAKALARSVRLLKVRLGSDGPVLDSGGRLAAAMPWLAHVSHADTFAFRGTVLCRLGRPK